MTFGFGHVLRKQLVAPQFTHGPWQWGVVHAVNAGPPPTVDLYLDGSQTLGDTAYLTKGVRYLSDYFPAVGDVVLVSRGTGGLRSDRVVLQRLAVSTDAPFQGYAPGTQSVGTGWTLITITPNLNAGNNFANSLYTVPAAGYYRFDGIVNINLNNNPQQVIAAVQQNGAIGTQGSEVMARGGTADDQWGSTIATIVRANVGDTLGLAVYNNGGNSVSVASTTSLAISPL